MNVYKFKSATQRGVAFGLAVGLLGVVSATAFPAGVVHADALNPLTERTLLLSSSSPGHHYLDAAGNATYAAPGSGPNGKQTGETFSFKVSTNSSASGFGFTNEPIEAFTFQYCTSAAGDCTAPGSNGTNLNNHYDTTAHGVIASDVGDPQGTVPVEGTDFEVWEGGVKHVASGADEWSMTIDNKQVLGSSITTNNFITLINAGSTMQPVSGTAVKIVFKASTLNYITNPEQGAFFVRINDYSDSTDVDPITGSIIDGGVTVANVMTDSIEIRTKVLETMSFSVGTTNPDTQTLGSSDQHGPCDAIAVNAPLYMGNSTAEYSLEVATAYDTHSYWRLSSNSSNGASVYYSGYTLSNTVGDQIDALWSVADSDGSVGGTQHNGVSHPGMEQFGLAFTAQDTPLDQTVGGHGVAGTNTLVPLIADSTYAKGSGADPGNPSINTTKDARFAFDVGSDQIPALLATEDTDVVGCTTGKMRYIANIAAVTPAGIYASKVNYLAAPQY